MKRLKISLIILIAVLLVGCRKPSKEISQSAAESVSERAISQSAKVPALNGKWQGRLGTYDGNQTYQISYDQDFLYFGQKKLVVTGENDNSVFTKTLEEQSWIYEFRLVENGLVVLPSFKITKGGVGGDLAPIELLPVYQETLEVNFFDEEEVSDYHTVMKKIYDLAEKKQPFELKVITFTIEGDPISQQITYDQEKIYYIEDNREDQYGGEERGIVKVTFNQLTYREVKDSELATTEKLRKEYVLSGGSKVKDYSEVVFDVTESPEEFIE